MQKTPQTRVLLPRTLSALALRVFVVLWALVALTSVIYLEKPQTADAAAAKTLNFQARLLGTNGGIVPDGTYHVEFKLYNSASANASAQGVCAGGVTDDCLWMETRTTGNLVTVKAGYLSVYLGDVTPLPANIWGEQLWLTMNIGGTSGPSWDGEMSPRLRLTAVPAAYSLVNTDGANSATLTLGTPANGNDTFVIPDQGQAGDQTYNLLTTYSANLGYIQNQTGSPQAANFFIQSAAGGNVGGIIRGAAGQSVALLQLQDSSSNVLASFSQTGALTLGNTTTQAGTLIFQDGANNFSSSIETATLTANRRFILPDTTLATTASPGTICVFNGGSSNCPAATGSAFYVQNNTTVQDQTNYYVRSNGNTVTGVLEGSNGQTANILNINTYNGTTSTTVASFTAAGNLNIAATLDTQTATTLNLGTTTATGVSISKTGATTTVNGALVVTQATTLNGGLTVANTGNVAFQRAASDISTTGLINDEAVTGALVRFTGATTQTLTGVAGGTNGRILTIFNAAAQALVINNDDAVNSTPGNTIVTGTGANISVPVGSSIILIYDSTDGVWRVASGSVAATGGYIQNQSSADQTADFRISGTGRANTSLLSPIVDALSSGTLGIGTTNATAITIGKAGITTTNGGALTVTELLTASAGLTASGGAISLGANAASSFTTSAGALTLTSATAATWSTTAGNLTIQAGSGTVSLGTSSTLTNDGALTITGGSTLTLGSTGANAVSIDTGGAAAVNIGGTNANAVSLGRTGITTTNAGALTVTQATTLNGGLTVSNGGNVAFQKATDISTTPTVTDPTISGALVRFTGASTQTLTGIDGGTDGRIITVFNAAAQALVINNNDGASGAANRIVTGTGANISVPAGSSVILIYDITSTVWRVASGTVAATGGYIQNQSSADQTADFRISGTGRANTSLLSPLMDALSGGTLGLGTSNATAVTIGKTGITTTNAGALTVSELLTASAGLTAGGGAIALTGNAASSFTTSAGALTLTSAAAATWSTGAGNLTLQAGSGTVSLGTSSTLTNAGALTITGGSTLTLNSTGANAVSIDTGAAAGISIGTTNANAVSIGNNTAATNVTINGGTGASAVSIQSGAGGTISIGSAANNVLNLGTGAVAGAITIGGTTQAGQITIGQSTATNTISIGAAAGNGSTQTINIGNSGTAGSTTNLVLGSTIAGATTLQSAGGVRITTLGSADTDSYAVCRDASTTQLTACDANNATGQSFLNGLNTFSGTATLGTNSTGAGALQIQTSSVARMIFAAATDNVYFGNADATGLAATPNAFTINGTGSSTAATAGGALTIIGGAGATATTGSNGGAVTIQGGTASGTNARTGGAVNITGGTPSATGAGGAINIITGAGGATSGNSGALDLRTGGVTSGNSSGAIVLQSGNTTTGTAGNISIDVGTGTSASAINIGTSTNSATKTITIGGSTGTGNITLGSSSATQSVLIANGTGAATVSIATNNTSAGTISMGNTNAGTTLALQGGTGASAVSIQAATSGTISIGSAAASTVNIGTGAFAHTIAIGTDSTTTQGITMGSTSASSTITIRGGTGASAVAIQAGSGGTISIGASAAATINVGTGAFAHTIAIGTDSTTTQGITIGSSSASSTTTIQGGTGASAVSIQAGSAGTISIGSATASTVNIATGAFAHTIAIGTNGTTTQGITIGSTSASSTTAITGGTGASALSLQAGTSGTISLATTNANTVNIGSTNAATVVNLQSGGGINIGTANVGNTIQIGNIANAVSQTINIGNNSTAGATTNIVLGATSVTNTGQLGTTTVQSVGGTTVSTTNRGATTNSAGTVAIQGGNGGTATTGGAGGAVTIQGGNAGGTGANAGGNISVTAGSSSATGTGAAGAITLQGGAALGGNTNGGAITIVGGAGVGTGSQGLVNLSTTAFTSSAVQAFGAGVTTITAGLVDQFSTIPVNATNATAVVSVPDPAQNTVIGRVLYIAARNGSTDFTLRLNAATTAIDIAMKANSTATLIWNGARWTAAGASSSTDLQSAYNNTLTSAGGAELVLNAPGGNADGLTIRNNATTPISGGVLEVQSSIGTNLFSVNNFGTELAANGGAETSSTFATNWGAGTPAGATVSRTTTAGQFVTGQAGVSVLTTSTALTGVRNNLSGNPVNTISAEYQVSFTAKSTLNGTQVQVDYSRNGGTNMTTCSDYGTGVAYATLSDTVWTKVTCTITIDSATAATDPDLFIRKIGATTPTIYIDNLSFMRNDSTTQPSNVQIGGGIDGGQITLFTLDRSSAPPVANGDTTYLGSMYYDTTTGRIQCYEADGWGACGSAPDNIITLTPEYTGATLNGTGVGTLTADFCSNEAAVLVVGSLCANHEARNFYRWTSPQATEQTYTIYVAYKLPSTFKAFQDANTIKLTALTTHTTLAEAYLRVFKKDVSANTVVSCGSATKINSSINTWQQTSFGGDETACGFEGGDNIIFTIEVQAEDAESIYVENLDFTYTNR